MIAATVTPAPWIHEQAGQIATVEQLIRRTTAALEGHNVSMSPSKVSRLIRAHVRRSSSLQVAARNLEAYCLTFADPTGETAIRNVMAAAR